MIVAPYQQQSQIDSTITYQYLTWTFYDDCCIPIIVTPSVQKNNYGLLANKDSSHLIEFLVNSIYIYDSKLIYYKIYIL